MSNRVQIISSHVHCKRIIRQFPLKLNSAKDYSWTQAFTLHAIKYYDNHGKLQQYYSPFIEHDHMYWYIMKEKERLGTTQHEETTLKPHEAQYVRDTCNEPSFKNIRLELLDNVPRPGYHSIIVKCNLNA